MINRHNPIRRKLLQTAKRASITALTFLPLGCSGMDYDPIISDKARPVSDDDARTAIVYDDRLEFPLSSQGWLEGIAPGNVLVSGYDTGFLRLVSSLETTTDAVIVRTEDAELTDVVEQGETSTTVDFADLDPASANASFPGLSPQAKAGEYSLDFNVPLTGKIIPLGEGVTARITQGSLSFKPSLDVGLAIQNRSVVEARVIANGVFSSEIKVEIEGSAKVNTQKEVPIWTSDLFDVRLPSIGLVPIACAGKLVVKAGFEFDAEGQVHVTVSQNLDLNGSLGIRYGKDTGWETVKSFEPHWAAQPPEMGADVQVQARSYLVGSVQLGFYGGISKKLSVGSAEVDLSVAPSLRFSYASTDPAPGWGLHGGLRVDATASLKVLKRDLASTTKNLYEGEKLLLPAEGSSEPPPINTGDCADGKEDGIETSVDCGGQCPNDCGKGEGCLTDGDCATGACVNGECTSASCDNGVQDADETGVDCGGSCPECSGGTCTDSTDCIGANCMDGVCEQPLSCLDGVQDDGESSIDCGGMCDPCGDWALNCEDGERNGDEEDVDCGGACPPCDGGGGGGGSCDGTGDCNTCYTCADQGACASTYEACSANPECTALLDCLSSCSDNACQNDCYAMHAGGEMDLQAYDACVICNECYNDCNGAGQCQ